ncbi:hypothetical protein NEAUS03_2230 [Nematocida ausubeli]|nr:hypothetical protein NEAUS03_2230 [Nematocida ausubeli]
MRGYIGNQNGYMYNKRFYSPEIDTDYALSKKRVFCRNKYIYVYKFTRNPVNDRVYKDIATHTPDSKYLISYNMQLIKMFPSVDENLSIEAARPNALTNFLRADHVKKDTKYILAALLLLSEGADIKINVDHTGEKKKLVIKSKTCEEKVFVNVEMHTEGIDPITNEHRESIYQSEAAEIIDFYIRCRDNPLLKKGGEFAMPATKEEFESGRFLNSAAFLIQTYIYEFIDTAESYKNFVEAVHELLVDQVAERENPEQTKKENESKMFDELFIEKEAPSQNIKYIELLCNLNPTANENAKFPFSDATQLPIQCIRSQKCEQDESDFEKNQELYYLDTVESALLGLFCCMAYNQKTGKYETSHMGTTISKEVRNFFEKYPKPVETIDYEMHKEWCKAVTCLKNDKIDYKQAKNELFSGIGNMFLAILEITRKRINMVELIQYIENICRTGELHEHHKAHIQYEIESIIKALSKNKNVRVEFNQMRLGTRSNGKTDIFGKIIITYTFGKVCNGISLDIRQEHTILALLKPSKANSAHIKEMYEKVKNIYSSVDCYIGYIAVQYVSAELDPLSFNSYSLLDNLEKKVVPIVEEGPESIYKIFVLGKISNIDIKEAIIKKFITCSIDKEVGPTNPLARFTANILGSVPLNDPSTRYQMMMSFPLHASWQKLYPRLGFKPSEPIPEDDAILICHSYLKTYLCNTLRSLSDPGILKAICNYLRATANNQRMTDLMIEVITEPFIFYRIMSIVVIEDLVEIQSILKESAKAYNLNYVYVVWFIHVCSGDFKFSLESIKTVYDFIVFDNYPNPFVFREGLLGLNEYFKKSINVLKENKTLFCLKNDRKSMKKYNAVLLYFSEYCQGSKKQHHSGCSIS